MRTWRRASFVERCGQCSGAIGVGDALLEFAIGTMKRRMIRCVRCADYPAPDDLPAFVPRVSVVSTPMAHIRTGADALPLDFKRAQAEREPGEEG